MGGLALPSTYQVLLWWSKPMSFRTFDHGSYDDET